MFDICGWKIKSSQVNFIYTAQNHNHIISVCTVKDILCPYTPQTKPPVAGKTQWKKPQEEPQITETMNQLSK